MKSTIWKSTIREIKQSLGRFLAILAIVALGVGFFAGLKVTKSAMVETTQQYLDENQFYDYRLLSTTGFTEEDAAFFREQEEVRYAQGDVTLDVLCKSDGRNESVIRVHSMPQQINQITLISGRMPQNGEECVVDSSLYGESQIGKKITLSENNEEKDLKNFAYREYTIVGIVQSSYYIQFERGNTSLGNGRVNGFIYLLPEGFAVDYDTEIFIKFNQDFPLYSTEYDSYMENKDAVWEDMVQEAAGQRYQIIRADSSAKLADAKEEYEEERAKAEKELADAKAELDDAAVQIADGTEQLSKAKGKLESGRETLETKEAEFAQAEQTVREKETQLDQAQIALGLGFAEGLKQLGGTTDNQSGEDLVGSLSQLGQQGAAISEAGTQITDAQKQISDGKVQLEAARQKLESGRNAIEKARQELTDGETELSEKELELRDAKAAYEEGMQKYEKAYHDFLTQTRDAEQEIADAEETLAELEPPDSYVLGRDTNVGYVCFESDSNIVEGIANVFPVFFFLVAALVCITTMNRMVEEQRTQIGVLKALGYRESTIMSKYMFYSGSAAVLGCLFGFFGGTYLFPKVIWFTYGMMYKVDSLLYIFDWQLALISLLVSLACSVGTTWLSCQYELSVVAAELMRPKAPKAGKRVILEYLPFVWKRLKFLQKVSVRNIFRYKKRFFMMVIGISGCTALLVTGFGIRDSIANVAIQQFGEIQIYDIGVAYSNPVDSDTDAALKKLTEDSIEDYTFVLEKTVDMETDGQIKSVNLVVVDEKTDISPFLDLHTKAQEPIAYPGKGEAVISYKVAETYGVHKGDTIELWDEDRNVITVTISGISQNFVYNYVYLSSDTYEEQMGAAPEYKTAYVNAEEGADVHLLSAALMNQEQVAAVTVNQDTMERFTGMMKSLNLIVVVVILCAAGLAFIVLYNLTNINITERVREVATIKVLGFYKKETSAYIFRENTVLTLIGAMVGLVLGHFLHQFVMNEINVDMVAFDIHVKPFSFVYSVLLTLAFAWFVNRMMEKKIERISMTESLKSVD